MKTFLSLFILCSALFTLYAQPPLEEIMIRGNQFYYQDNRLKTYDDLQSVLRQSRDEQVMKNLQSGKTMTTAGAVLGVAGLGAILLNSISNSADPLNATYGLTIAGLGIEVAGLGLVLAGRRKTRKAVELYNAGF